MHLVPGGSISCVPDSVSRQFITTSLSFLHLSRSPNSGTDTPPPRASQNHQGFWMRIFSRGEESSRHSGKDHQSDPSSANSALTSASHMHRVVCTPHQSRLPQHLHIHSHVRINNKPPIHHPCLLHLHLSTHNQHPSWRKISMHY